MTEAPEQIWIEDYTPAQRRVLVRCSERPADPLYFANYVLNTKEALSKSPIVQEMVKKAVQQKCGDKDKFSISLYKEPVEFWDKQTYANQNDSYFEEKSRRERSFMITLLLIILADVAVAISFIAVWL